MNDEDLRTVETYRLELYMQACENLSAENEAVRLSGAQTLVGLGDIWHSDKTFPEETSPRTCAEDHRHFMRLYTITFPYCHKN